VANLTKDDDVSLLLDDLGVPLTDDLPGLVAANLAPASPALTQPILVVVGIPGVAALAPRALDFGLHALAAEANVFHLCDGEPRDASGALNYAGVLSHSLGSRTGAVFAGPSNATALRCRAWRA
jgi:hypothetical protein